jgi:hypothetical protein
MKKELVISLWLTVSIGFTAPSNASADASCPTESTLEGRMRIADGEPSCAELAKRAIPARQISPSEKKRIMAAFDTLLVDSPSARWRWGKVIRGNVACLWVNSRNRMGGYSGWSEYTFDLESGDISSSEELDALLARLGTADSSNNICGAIPSS